MRYEKGTFIIIPNKDLLRGKPSELQSVFFWLCEHSNDDGICFPSRRTVAKESGVGVRTVDKVIAQLSELELIKKTERKTEQKVNKSNLYQIMIVQKDTTQCQKEHTPSVEKDTTPSVKKSTVTVSSINSIHLTSTEDKSSDDIFDSKQYTINLASGNNQTMKVIGMFAYRKELYKRFTTREQFNGLIKRYIKIARELSVFSTEQLKEAFVRAESDAAEQKYEWTLETAYKFLTK